MSLILLFSNLQFKKEPRPSVENDEYSKLPLSEWDKRKRPQATVTSVPQRVRNEANTSSQNDSQVVDEKPIHPTKKRRVDEGANAQGRSNEDSEMAPVTPAQNQTNNGRNGTPNSKKNKNKNKHNLSVQKGAQSSNKPVDFDYSQVDFNKFQGGSHKHQPNNEIKTKFHGKVSRLKYGFYYLIFFSK